MLRGKWKGHSSSGLRDFLGSRKGRDHPVDGFEWREETNGRTPVVSRLLLHLLHALYELPSRVIGLQLRDDEHVMRDGQEVLEADVCVADAHLSTELRTDVAGKRLCFKDFL